MDDIAALPLILCGPMLRRVEARQVSVFMALKEERWIELALYEDLVAPGGNDPLYTHATFRQARQQTVPLGAHLHVAVATLHIPAEHGGQSFDSLRSGVTYGYDVRLFTSSDGGSATGLADSGLLDAGAGTVPIGFIPGHLPSFAVPPADLATLNVLHGSCRKPHGEGVDMLATVDDLMLAGNRYLDPLGRPHLLLLTGDQIYADDVAPPLLRAVHELGKTLLGWTEVFPGTGPGGIDGDDGLPEDMATVKALVEPLVDTLAANPHQELQGLVAALTEAIDDPASGSWTADIIVTLLLKRQLRDFRTSATQLLENTDDAAAEGLTALAAQVHQWIVEHEQVFTDLSSDHSWGRIGLVESETDHVRLDAIRRDVQAVLKGGPAGEAELDRLAGLLRSDRESRGLGDLLADRAAFLATIDLTAPGAAVDAAIKDFGAQFVTTTRTLRTYLASRISPPQRAKELRQFAKLTSDAMTAHLMFLGEFYAMYLFAWSDAVWPRTGQGAITLPPAREAVPNYGLVGALSPRALDELGAEVVETFAATLTNVRRVLANVPSLMIFDDHEVTDDWNLHCDWVASVNGSPMGPQVLRNAMAAYAVFQDWGNQPSDYLDGTAQLPTGRRLLNMLAVGPAGSDGRVQPPAMAQAGSDGPAKADTLFGVGPGIAAGLPIVTAEEVIRDLVGGGPDGEYAFVVAAGRKRWDWVYEPYPETPLIRFIALDTRTCRGFPTVRWATGVRLAAGEDLEIDGRIAAPILVHPAELTTQLEARMTPDRVNVVISPAPVFGLPLLEGFLQRLKALSSGPEVADFESWAANPHGLGELLRRLRTAPVVLLSGDVHYGYTNQLTVPGPEAHILLQLCSSSMKNEDGLTRMLGAVGREASLAEFLTLDDFSRERFGFLLSGFLAALADVKESILAFGADVLRLATWLEETAPAINFTDPESYITYFLALKDTVFFEVQLPTLAGVQAIGSGIVAFALGDLIGPGEPGEARLTMHFLADDRDAPARRSAAAALNGIDVQRVPDGITDVDLKLRQMTEVVGFNNVGRLTFDVDPGVTDPPVGDIRHELVWRVHRPDAEPEELLASTIHHATGSGPGGEWERFRFELAARAEEEYRRWHPDGSPELRETDDAGLAVLREYVAFLSAENEQLPIHKRFWDPVGAGGGILSWSGHFISYVVKRARAGSAFSYSARHIDYVRAAKRNREAGNANPFYLYRKEDEQARVLVGDIVVGSQGGPFSYDDVDIASDAFRPAHCDVVVGVVDDAAIVVGGNVTGDEGGDGVTVNRRSRPLDGGRLTQPHLLGIIRARTEA